MPSGDLNHALQLAQSYCWDETHGYNMGGMGYPDFDCSGFVGRCLHEAGFNYPAYHVGTINMGTALTLAGFTELPYDRNTFVPQHGDIFVQNHWDLTGGHTFFYCENIRAYTDPNAYSSNIDVVNHVRVEASSSRGETESGDHRRNGTGAYWEVWCHAYNSLEGEYQDNEIFVYRWTHGTNNAIYGALLLWKLLIK